MTGAACGERPSPNFGPRRDGKTVDMLLLHYTGMGSASEALERLCDPHSGVSSHYFVDEDGSVLRLVAEEQRAWHAGAAWWKGESDINSVSIGVEIHNRGHDRDYPDFPEPQMVAVEALCLDIVKRHAIAPERVLAHSDVAPDRKLDPGEKFDWPRLARAGVGHWVEPEPVGRGGYMQFGDEGPAVEALQAMLGVYGYRLDVTARFDTACRDAVTAFQRHFRPARVDGIADRSTVATLHRLLKALPGATADAVAGFS